MTYPADGEVEAVREGYAPDKVDPNQPYGSEHIHNLDEPIKKSDPESGEAQRQQQQWENKSYGTESNDDSRGSPKFGSFSQERDVWAADRR